MVAVGSVDLHSLAQLFLAGPNDKYTSFIRVLTESKQSLKVPDHPEVNTLVEDLRGRSFSRIMEAIFGGTVTAYLENKRSSTLTLFLEKSEYTVGQWLQWKMMEMMYLGALYEVNPFDQPKVEDYKRGTREILKTGRYAGKNPYQKQENNLC
jgi:glucose-6-phosphate isomerase